MCPFIIQNENHNNPDLTPHYTVFTSATPSDNFFTHLIQYARTLVQKGQRVLLFDASLGLGDLTNIFPSTTTQSTDSVLQEGKSLSTLITSYSGIDLITGESKHTNLGNYNFFQLQNIFRDLKLLGMNYRQIIIYVPSNLPSVQDFFCRTVDSICVTSLEKDSIAAAAKLTDKYPLMSCYILPEKNKMDPQKMIQLELMINPKKILLNLS